MGQQQKLAPEGNSLASPGPGARPPGSRLSTVSRCCDILPWLSWSLQPSTKLARADMHQNALELY